MLTSCWARYRTEPNPWLVVSTNDGNENEQFGDMDNSIISSNAIKESDLLDKYLSTLYKRKSVLHRNPADSYQDRRKKFLTDSTNIQGLWTLPGRR